MFADRVAAGRALAGLLESFKGLPNAVVLGIPRGGVVVAAEVARALRLPLDVALAAKVGAPGNPEFAIAALAADGVLTLNPAAGFGRAEALAESDAAHAKLTHEQTLFRQDRPAVVLAGRIVLLIDDGLATGLTMRAAAEWARREGAAYVVVAAPVASRSALVMLSQIADEVIAVETPTGFSAVGQFYRDFGQTSDDEVVELLDAAAG